MIRRNFIKATCGAIAALFVPKVAEAVVEKTTPYFDPEALERAAWTTSQMESEDVIAAMRQQREAAMESLAKDLENGFYYEGPIHHTKNLRFFTGPDGRMKAGSKMTG